MNKVSLLCKYQDVKIMILVLAAERKLFGNVENMIAALAVVGKMMGLKRMILDVYLGSRR